MLGRRSAFANVITHYFHPMKIASFLLLLVLAIPAFAQRDSHGLPSSNANLNAVASTEKGSEFLATSMLTAYEYDSVRELSELNVPLEADAYPWLSSDGLRLYYTAYGNPSDMLVMAERVNTNSYFSAPVVMPLIAANPISFWLSTDELDLYFTDGMNFQYSHRSAIGATFDLPTIIDLVGLPTGFVVGPSLNAAHDTLYILHADVTTTVMKFGRTTNTSFTYVSSLPALSNYEFGPGQLSKDELVYFTGARYNGGFERMYQLTRPTTSSPFLLTTFEEIEGINDTTSLNGQPSMSDGLEWVALVRAINDDWGYNDLFIAHKGATMSAFDPKSLHIAAFPNPSQGSFTVKVGGSIESEGDKQLQISNVLGDVIHQQTIESEATISDLSSGVYIVKVSMGENAVTKKLVVY
jgi:hypothetical protein